MLDYRLPDTHTAGLDALRISIDAYKKGLIRKDELKHFHVKMGIYEQRISDTYMLRIRNPGGIVTPKQFEGIANIAAQYKVQSLHITTRQEIQIHGLPLDDLVPVMRALENLSLSSYAGGGNTIRNITAPHDSGVSADETFDVEPHLLFLTEKLICDSDSVGLPRKFKIAFSHSDKDTALASVHDIGFIAARRDGKKGFRVFVAGGQGGRPAAGRLLLDFIEEHEIYPVTLALRNVFARYGNRENRTRARLRFLWEDIGEDEFRARFTHEFDKVRISVNDTVINNIENGASTVCAPLPVDDDESFTIWKIRYAVKQRQEGYYSILFPVFLGDLTTEKASLLARFASRFGENTIRLSIDQNLWLRNIPEMNLADLYSFTRTMVHSNMPVFTSQVVSCTGAATCRLGLCLSHNAAKDIVDSLCAADISMDEIATLKIKLSGCPNACGQHWTADLGFFGIARKAGIHQFPAYQVVLGGQCGANGATLAIKAGVVPARRIGAFTADLLKLYTDKRNSRSFSKYLQEEGKDDIDDLLNGRYSAIPEYSEEMNFYCDCGSEQKFSTAK